MWLFSLSLVSLGPRLSLCTQRHLNKHPSASLTRRLPVGPVSQSFWEQREVMRQRLAARRRLKGEEDREEGAEGALLLVPFCCRDCCVPGSKAPKNPWEKERGRNSPLSASPAGSSDARPCCCARRAARLLQLSCRILWAWEMPPTLIRGKQCCSIKEKPDACRDTSQQQQQQKVGLGRRNRRTKRRQTTKKQRQNRSRDTKEAETGKKKRQERRRDKKEAEPHDSKTDGRKTPWAKNPKN